MWAKLARRPPFRNQGNVLLAVGIRRAAPGANPHRHPGQHASNDDSLGAKAPAKIDEVTLIRPIHGNL